MPESPEAQKPSGGAPSPGANWRWPAILLRLALLVALIYAGNLFSHWVIGLFEIDVGPKNEHIVHRVIMASIVVYALLIAIPFVPGVEIGLALLVMVGPGLAILVYVATVAGLMVSFLIGQFLPDRWLQAALKALHLHRSAALVTEMRGLGRDARLAFVLQKAPTRIVPFLLRHRYIALAVLLNLPGNAVIGGGGGIALIAGLSRLYSTPRFIGTLVLAVAPVPLAVMLLGPHVLV